MWAPERGLELRNWLPVLVWLAALAVALNSGWVVAYRLLYLFTGLILLGLFWSAGTVWSLSVRREPLRGALHAGDVLVERVLVRNRSFLPQMWVALEDESELPLHLMRQVLSYIGPRSQRQFILRTLCLRRGRYRLGPAVLSAGDPFGIFRTRRRLKAGATVVVYPRVFALDSLSLLAGLLQVDTRRARRSPEPTTDVATVRDYRSGDEFRRIHWRSTARHGRLMSKEFDYSPGGDVWIVLDMQQHVQAGSLLPIGGGAQGPPLDSQSWPAVEPSTEEYAVSMAASIAACLLRAEREVGFLSYAESRHLVQPDRGERHLGRILDILAVSRAIGRIPLDHVLQREAHNFRRFDTVVLITPSVDEAWVDTAHALALRGLRVLAVVVDRDTFTDRLGSHRIKRLLAAWRLPFCVVENGRRPDEALCLMA